MAFNEKMFLDWAGLQKYDELLKKYIAAGDKELKDLIDGLNPSEVDLTTLEALAQAAKDQADANKEKLDTLNADVNTEGSVAKQAKDAADAAVSALVDGAPEAYDTLKEIASWIQNTPEGTNDIISQLAALGERVGANETAIGANSDRITINEGKISTLETAVANVETEVSDLKDYVDAQDKDYYDRIQSIQEPSILGLFMDAVYLEEGQTVAQALQSLDADEKLVLAENSTITEDLVIPSGAVIEANGSTFTGSIIVPEDATIMDAIFIGTVTIG